MNLLLKLPVKWLRYPEPDALHLVEHTKRLGKMTLPITFSEETQGSDYGKTE